MERLAVDELHDLLGQVDGHAHRGVHHALGDVEEEELGHRRDEDDDDGVAEEELHRLGC